MAQRLPTAYAPAERSDNEHIHRDYRLWRDAPEIAAILDAVASPTMILDEHRQVVYANAPLKAWLGASDIEGALGLRPGEALGCTHAHETAGGCGTTLSCRYCGAVNAILSAQRGSMDVQECRILRDDGGAWDLRVWAKPFHLGEAQFTAFSVLDIADEKRRRVLERVFFHDVLNTSGVIRSVVDLMSTMGDDETDPELLGLLNQATYRLVEEIHAQRDLLAAESGDLELDLAEQESLSFVETWVRLYSAHDAGADKTLAIAEEATSVTFVADGRLLGRVLGNLIKNALEASDVGGTVTVGCGLVAAEASEGTASRVHFWIHNAGVMSAAARSQVFNRSFSTKGAGRGLGTYSVKMLCERYLDGRVWFESTDEAGTTFHVTLPA